MEIILKCSPGGLRLATRISRIMKLTTFLLIAGLLQVQAKGISQKISLSFKKAPLEKVFTNIEQQSGYSFVYKYNDIAGKYVTDISLKNVDLNVALDACLKEQNLQYTIEKNIIAIKKMPQIVIAPPVIEVVKEIAKEPISGTVVNEKGEPMPAVSVIVKGTNRGDVTNEKGFFTLQVDKGEVLVFSSVGYEQREVTVGNQTTLSITLKAAKEEMEKVVVTAMGIKRKEKALTYTVQEISGSEVNTVKEVSFVNSLAGKVAGVTINSSAAGMGGSTKVVMRGTKSIMGNNNALYVIDGIPMPSLASTQSSDIYESKDNGDGISNINPDDIENVTVLTGASAAALYGSDAANGVILITTKKGVAGKTSFSISNSTNFSSPFVKPRFQNTYGSDPESYQSWGHKLETPSSYDPQDFFQTGVSINNNFSFSTGTEKSQTYVSGAMLNAKGIIPNNTFDRYNFSVRNTTSFLDDRLNLDLNVMYVKQKDQNMIGQGLYFNPLVPVYLFPRGDDIEKYKVYERYDIDRNFKTQFWPFGNMGFAMQNPYWIINRNFFNNDKDRYIVGAALKYNIVKWLNVTGRVRMDNTYNTFEKKLYATTETMFAGENGYYANYGSSAKQSYADVMFNANKSFKDFSITGYLGASLTDIKYVLNGYGGDLNVANLFSFANINSTANHTVPAYGGYHRQKQAFFATAQLGYKNKVFLDVTDRQEYASQLAGASTMHYNYPSVGLSAIVSDMVKMNKNIVSFIKVRGSYAEVGNPPALDFITKPSYPLVGGVPASTTYAPASWLVPERTKSWEFGASLKFLKNKINLDVTYYSANTYNQLFNSQLGYGSGYSNLYINSGKISNKGIEASLGYNGKILPQLNWSSTVTFSANRNKILDLVTNFKDPNSDDYITLDTLNFTPIGTYKMMLTKGGSMGDLYVSGLVCDEHGYIKVDPMSGAIAADNNTFLKAGNANPRYNIGFRNSFDYKNFTIGFLIDGRFGGVCISATEALMDQFGVSEGSAQARDQGGATKNGYPVTNIQNYYATVAGGTTGVLAEYVYSATNVRLREASIAYTFTGLFNNTIKSVNVALIGRNLFMFYNKAPFDPELAASTSTYYQGLDYFMQPSLRSVGFSVKLQF